MRKKNTTAADMRVFESEEELWNADESVKTPPNIPYRLVDNDTHDTFWCWAPSKQAALGLVTQFVDIYQVSKVVEGKTSEMSMAEILAAVKRLPESERAKVMQVAKIVCPYCGLRTSSTSGLTNHIRKKHPGREADNLPKIDERLT